MRWIAVMVCSAAMAGSAVLSAAQAVPPKTAAPGSVPSKPAGKEVVTKVTLPPSPKALLPDAMDGWIASAPAKVLADAATADPANASALKEYEFTGGATTDYKRDGETLSIRALRFQDASGAYGAYSFYRQNGWPKADIGTGGASNHNRVLFWKGDVVIDASYSHIGPLDATEMRKLAARIPTPSGNRSMMPPILANLPQQWLDPQTTHYAEGPVGYVGGGGVLPAELVGFDRGAEAATASYSLSSGPATLTIIDYPTPQMAEAMEKKIGDYVKAGNNAQPPWTKALKDSDVASLEVRRSGPLVVVVSGDAIPNESHRLIETVHFQADLVALPQQTSSEISKTAKLLMGIAGIVIVGSSAAILLGFFLGGGRALYRIARGKPASSMYDEDFISINLREKWDETLSPVKSPNPKG
jgi:hypothetical protein